jgi:hypothetical protein
MSARDWILPARYPLCPPADSLYRTGQAIFHNLSGAVTSDKINAAQEALAQHRTELALTLHPLHFGVSVGRHICVEDVYCEAKARLRGLAATIQPAPESPATPPAPARSPQPLSDEELMERLKEYVKESTKDTFFGQDQKEEEEQSS